MDQHHIDGGSLIEVAIEAKSAADQARLLTVLQALVADDASLRYSHDVESGQTIFGGQSEHHLDEAVDKIMRTHGVALNIGAPQVAYRERLTRAVEVSHTHMKIIGGAGEFARVSILFEPSAPNSGFAFEILVSDDTLLKEHVSGVRQGVEAARQTGVVAGFPVIDFKATLTGGAYHELDSNSRTFEIAARSAFLKLREERVIELLEPIFAAEVVTPEAFLGAVIGDLNRRRGQVMTVEKQNDASLIKALVPVSNMFGYLNNLRSLTRGVGTVSLRLDRYEPVPRSTNGDDPGFPPAAAMRMRA
jgi:elongation factor G